MITLRKGVPEKLKAWKLTGVPHTKVIEGKKYNMIYKLPDGNFYIEILGGFIPADEYTELMKLGLVNEDEFHIDTGLWSMHKKAKFKEDMHFFLEMKRLEKIDKR